MPRIPSTIKSHRETGPRRVSAAVITVSDTRTIATDASGALIKELLAKKGHSVVRYALCKDDEKKIARELADSLSTGCDVILIDGGTGFAPRDVTIETVSAHLDRQMPGFGELFRRLSYGEIGSASMLSRALAGTIGRVAVFCIPGSPGAVDLAMNRLILPELGHLVGLLRGHTRRN